LFESRFGRPHKPYCGRCVYISAKQKSVYRKQLTAIEKGREAYQHGNIDAAVELFLEGIKLSPDNTQAYYGLAEMLTQAKNYKDAIDILREIPLNEEDVRRFELFGYCKEGMEIYDEALKYADRALSVKGGSAAALNLKGLLAYKQGEMRFAEDYFKKAIESDPGYGEPYTNYHSAIIASGTLERGAQVFEEAGLLYPNSKVIKYKLIDALIQQGKNKEAMHQIEEAIALFGVDDGILAAALKIRELLGPKVINKKTKRKSTVSLCTIVKNEEKCLAKCLRSVKPIVDEMIVVDTGSTDLTGQKILPVFLGPKYMNLNGRAIFLKPETFLSQKLPASGLSTWTRMKSFLLLIMGFSEK